MSQLAELTTITQKRYKCRHIHAAGLQCGSPALRGEQFCYFHHTTRSRKKTGGFRYLDATEPFELPLVEDRASALSPPPPLLFRIASNDLDLGRAGKLLYNLQILTTFLPREKAAVILGGARGAQSKHPDTPQPAPSPQPLAEEQPLLEELVLDETHGLIAPITELPQNPVILSDTAAPTNNEAPATNNEACTTNNEARTANNEARTANNEAPTTNNEACTTNNEARTANNEARTANNEAPTTNNEARTTDNEARTTDNDPLQNCHPERSSASAPNAVEGPAVASHTATAESAIPTKSRSHRRFQVPRGFILRSLKPGGRRSFRGC